MQEIQNLTFHIFNTFGRERPSEYKNFLSI